MTVTSPAPTPPPEAQPGSPETLNVKGLHVSVTGTGDPVTVFAHGLGGSTAETKPLASATPGTRVLFDFRGHGLSADLDAPWDYRLLAEDLASVADAVGATRALGVSMGAGALLRLASQEPDRFARIAFVMPASIDSVRSDPAVDRLHQIADLVERGQDDHVVEMLLGELPVEAQQMRAVRILLRRRAREISARKPPYPIAGATPLESADDARAVTTPALVLAQNQDAIHPVSVAEQLHALLPASTLRVLEPAGIYWTQNAVAREIIADHLCR